RARGATDRDLQLVRFDLDIHLFRFGQDGYGGGTRVYAALRFGGRHALDPMHAALMFEALVHIGAADIKHDFFEPTEVRGTGVDRSALPPARLGIARVHSVQTRHKERGFRTAGAGANFNNSVARVGGIRRHQTALDFQG